MQRYKDLGNREVEAVQVWDVDLDEIVLWCQGIAVLEHDAFDHNQTFGAVNVPTIEGKKRASQGDYIVKDSRGIFSVMKPGQFHLQFEPA